MQSQYEITLCHYGTPGMKWGVRREIGARARVGARVGKAISIALKGHNRSLEKLDKRVMKKHMTENGLDEDGVNADVRITKLLNKIDIARVRINNMIKLKNNLLRDLSPADIEKGRRQANSPFFNTPLALPATLGEYNSMKRKYGGA